MYTLTTLLGGGAAPEGEPEQLHKVPPSPGHPGPDRANGAATHLGSLRVPHPEHLGQDKRVPPVLGQLTNGKPKRDGVVDTGQVVHGRLSRRLPVMVTGDLGPSGSGPKVVDDNPPRDREQPGPRITPRGEPMNAGKRANKGLLRKVLSLVTPNQVDDKPPNIPLRGTDEGVGRGPIPPPSRESQVGDLVIQRLGHVTKVAPPRLTENAIKPRSSQAHPTNQRKPANMAKRCWESRQQATRRRRPGRGRE